MIRTAYTDQDHEKPGSTSFSMEEVEGSIGSRFRRLAALHADRPAVVDEDGSISYRQLVESTRRVCQFVRAQSGDSKSPIAILCGLRLPAIEAILGVLDAGEFYVPIDPTIPKARIQNLLEDSTAKLLLTDSEHEQLAKQIAPPSVRVVSVESLTCDDLGMSVAQDHDGLADLADAVETRTDDLAYVIYTSGSTGRPKGVMQTHRNVLVDIRRQTCELKTACHDRFGLIFPIAFSASTCAIFGALLSGATLCLFDLKTRGLRELSEWLTDQRIGLLDINVTTLRALAAILPPDRVFPAMRMIAPCSEPVCGSEFEIFKRHFNAGCVMQNALGTTETRVLTQGFLTHTTDLTDDLIPIGWDVDDKEILLLDESGEPVANGDPGQIVVRSRYLSPGYWRNQEETERAFQTDKHDPEFRLYFTGDMARRSANGCLTHLGRTDFQINIRGNRIEAGEIETIMQRMPGIKNAAVISWIDENGQTRLDGFFVGHGSYPDSAEIRKELLKHLPRFMIPQRFVVLGSLPVNANGKLDRLALQQTAKTTDRSLEYIAAPQTSTEKRLHQIWNDVIKLRDFGIDEDFFDLGGDSLGAMRVCAEIELAFDRFVPLVKLSDGTTIRSLAAELDGDFVPVEHGPLLLQPSQNDEKKPIFCVPGIGGHAASFRMLLEKFDHRREAYGLQYPGIDDLSEPIDTVEGLATHFIEKMKLVQPEGPYRLIGYSLGGLVIYEMARQLKLMGETCEWVFLVDTLAPGGSRPRNIASRVMGHVKKQYSMRGSERIVYFMDCFKQRFISIDLTSKAKVNPERRLELDSNRPDWSRR